MTKELKELVLAMLKSNMEIYCRPYKQLKRAELIETLEDGLAEFKCELDALAMRHQMGLLETELIT